MRRLLQIFMIFFLVQFSICKNDNCLSDDFCEEKYNNKYFCNTRSKNCDHEVIIRNPTVWNIIGKFIPLITTTLCLCLCLTLQINTVSILNVGPLIILYLTKFSFSDSELTKRSINYLLVQYFVQQYWSVGFGSCLLIFGIYFQIFCKGSYSYI